MDKTSSNDDNIDNDNNNNNHLKYCYICNIILIIIRVGGFVSRNSSSRIQSSVFLLPLLSPLEVVIVEVKQLLLLPFYCYNYRNG